MGEKSEEFRHVESHQLSELTAVIAIFSIKYGGNKFFF